MNCTIEKQYRISGLLSDLSSPVWVGLKQSSPVEVLSGLDLITDRDQKVSKLFYRPDPTQNPVKFWCEISKSRKLLNPRKI
jgi:hypothetical protein